MATAGSVARPRTVSTLTVAARRVATVGRMTESRSDHPLPSTDHPVSPDGARRPVLLVFDVNETLSDMSAIGRRFEDVGAPANLAKTWFAGLLRDGFALTAVDACEPFARIAAETLRVALHDQPLDRGIDDAIQHVMQGFSSLPVHPDVPNGVRVLSSLGIRLVTLSNGSASVAEALFERAGIGAHFDALLSVEDVGVWKPPTHTRSSRPGWTPWTRCWSPSTRGTSTVPRAPDSRPPGSTGPAAPIPRTSGPLTWPHGR